MKQLWIKALLVVSAAALMMVGCNTNSGTVSEEKNSVAPPENKDPVTLTMYFNNAISDLELQRLLHEPLKKKYPYITVEAIQKPNVPFQTLLASGKTIDLFNFYQGAFGELIQADLLEDMTPLLKQYNVDLNRFEPVVIQSIRAASDKGELFALPRLLNTVALYYNKDIFDKFGVPYPKDGMTWEQTIDIARKVTRTDNGVNYYGLGSDGPLRAGLTFSLSPVDPKTNKANLSTPEWRRAFELQKAIYSIPGNIPVPASSITGGPNQFTKTRNLAMLASINHFSIIELAANEGLNWDLVQYPSFSDKMNIGGMVDVHAIGVTKVSEHKDAAMKVIEVMLSDEVQMLMSKTGTASPLVNPEIKKQFGADAPFLKGKNVQAMLKSNPAPSPQFSIYYNNARTALTPIFIDYIIGNKDINTAIREGEEAINKVIAGLSAK